MMGTGVGRGEERAREAAEAAIRSPLLEDVDLNGAKGILVNITAGLDMNLGEFSDVGATVEEFASENATVVIGTVIDPEMVDELKVTVVATGLEGAFTKNNEPSISAVVNNSRSAPPQSADISLTDHAAMTKSESQHPASATEAKGEAAGKIDYLDIPAFLRRQAD
jgi:cell division protein FtsZ